MSVTRWPIIGYGIKIDNIAKYINNNKVKKEISNLLPNETTIFDEDILQSDCFCGNPYYYFSEFLADLDNHRWFTYDSNGDGDEFFLYPPKYPWEIRDDDPKSMEDIDKRLIEILNKICDMPDEYGYLIDYIEEEGWG